MKSLLKNKTFLKIAFLAAIIGLASTPVGQKYQDTFKPLVESIVGM